MSAASPASTPIVLRAAAVWGTTVLEVRNLTPGSSFQLGESEGAVIAKPDGSLASDYPVRAVGSGWELDARGATGGRLWLRGREENPVELARSGAPIPIVAGDYGLLQYGAFSVFFQFTHAPPLIKQRRRIEWGLLFAFVFSTVAVVGGLLLLWAITSPPAIEKPLELTSQQELLLRFNIKEEPEPEPTPETGQDKDKGSGVENPGAKDPKPAGGGRKMAGKEGLLGRQGKEDKTELPGEVQNGLGGMADVLSSDVGDEVKKTLGTISSVADALGGLRSDRIVLGRGPGTGLRGTGSGGGGDGPGVPFGSGTLDTGWGPGRGGGFGAGTGGPGGPGSGGTGRGGRGGGTGTGDGSGTSERKVTGSEAPKAGQGLSPGQISRVVNSRAGAFRACYEIAAARDPELKGGVTVSFSITPGGSVSSASVGGSTLGNPRAESCILRQFQRLQFPAADKATGASWPLFFRPAKKR